MADEDVINQFLGVQGPVLDANAVAPRGAVATETFAQRNSRGLPIDTASGVNPFLRFQIAAQKSPEQKVAMANQYFGQPVARLADDGTVLVKMVDPDTNQPKEVSVNEDSFSMGDIAALLPVLPEIYGAFRGMRAGQALPWIGKAKGVTGAARDITAAAVGQESAGLVKDLVTDAPLTAQEVLAAGSARASNIPADIAIDTALLGAGRVAGKIVTPFGASKGELEREAMQARQYFKEKYGVDFPMTAGESTGSPIIRRTEATMKPLPGATSNYEEILKQKAERFREIAARMGVGAQPGGEEVAEAASQHLLSKVGMDEAGIASLRAGARASGEGAIRESIAKATKAVPELYPEQVGASIKSSAKARYDAFQTQAAQLYDAAYAMPGGTDRILVPQDLAKGAKDILDTLASVEKTKTVQTGLLGPTGQPLTSTKTITEPLSALLPEGVEKLLHELASAKGGKVSLSDLVQARTGVANKIAKETGGLPTVKVRELERIRDLLTDTIEKTAAAAPDPRLKQAWEAANDFYRKGAPQFHEGPIARLFKGIDEPGFVPDENIVRNIDNTQYQSLRKFFGPASAEITSLKRAIADDLVESAIAPGMQVLDGKTFARNLTNLYKDHRAIAEDIFGPKTSGPLGGPGKLYRIAEVLDDASATPNAESVRELLKSGADLGTFTQRLKDIVQAEKAFTERYKAKIFDQLKAGHLGDGSFKPVDFVNRVLDDLGPKEAQQVVMQLSDNPELLNQVRQKAVERIFFVAQRRAKALDPVRLGAGEPIRMAETGALADFFGNEERKRTMKEILGPNIYRDFEEMTKLLRLGEGTEASFRAAGGLSAGMQTAAMIRGGVLRYASDFIKQKVAAILLTNPATRRWISNTALSAGTQEEIGRALLVSAPFLEALDKEFGPQKTEEIADSIRTAIQRASPSKPVDATKDQAIDRILGPAKPAP